MEVPLVKQDRNVSIVCLARYAIAGHQGNNAVVHGPSAHAPACPPPSRLCHAGPWPARLGSRQDENYIAPATGCLVGDESHDLCEAALRAEGSNGIFSRPSSKAPASLYPHPICRWNCNSAMGEHESAGSLLSGRTPQRSEKKRFY